MNEKPDLRSSPNPPRCPRCHNDMQLAEENPSTRRYICGCPPFGIITVNVNLRGIVSQRLRWETEDYGSS